MGDDPEYTKFGPYTISAALQEEHGHLIADSDWPAMATQLPESNTVSSHPWITFVETTNQIMKWLLRIFFAGTYVPFLFHSVISCSIKRVHCTNTLADTSFPYTIIH